MQVCQNLDFFEIFFEILNQKIARIPNIFSDFVSDQKCGFSTGSDFYFNERQNLVTSRARISAAHNTSPCICIATVSHKLPMLKDAAIQ